MRFIEMLADKDHMDGEELVTKHNKLRIFRSVNRTFPVMQREKFNEGRGSTNKQEEAIAMAVFEVMKDLVKIGLPESPVQA